MNNFIRQLLQRTLAPAATIQPRIPSRFESAAAPVRFTEERIETAAAAPVAAASSRAVASAASQVALPRSEISSPVAPSPPVANPRPAAPPSAIPAVPALLSASPVFPVANPAPVAPLAQAPSFSTPPAIAARETFSLPPPSVSTLLIERVTERIRESSPASGAGISPAPVAPASSVAAAAMAPATLSPIAVPRSSSATPAALPLVPPSAPPTIRVTIGRVDIRAIHAAPPAPVRAPAPERRPLVSLEAYLSQRDAK